MNKKRNIISNEICTEYIHDKCKSSKCRKRHLNDVKLCPNYFSGKEQGCELNERCIFSHKIKMTLSKPLLCYTAHLFRNDVNYYTKDGETWYENENCRCKNGKGIITRQEM